MKIELTCPHCGKHIKKSNLSEMSWKEISDISYKGKAREHFNIGDTKAIELLAGEKVELVIADIRDERLTNGTIRQCITFATKYLLESMHFMNNKNTNEGGWEHSHMRQVTMPRLEKLLPGDLSDVIKTVEKETSGNTTEDKLFLFSETEVFGEAEYGEGDDGTQLAYFKDENVREMTTIGGNEYWWWLRSPHSGDTTTFCMVYADGAANANAASASGGVCLGFCV